MEDNEPINIFFGSPSPRTSSKSSTTDSDEEVPLNQQIPRIAETNSVAGDWLNSSQDLNDNEPSWRGHPSNSSDTDGDDHPISPNSEGDHPMENLPGEAFALVERSDDEIPTVQRNYRDHALHYTIGMEPWYTVTYLFSRAEAFIEELLRSLNLSRSSDYPPPPGRLPVSISQESQSPSIQMKINLKNRTSSIVQQGNIPPRFSNENDRNKGLPTMHVSAESIRGWFDLACKHFAFWVTRLIAVMDDVQVGDEILDADDFGVAFELFQKEFLDFDEMATLALKRLRALVGPDVFESLDARHREVQNTYFKLEIAFLSGRMKGQAGYISFVTDEIENVVRSIWTTYTAEGV